MKRKKRNYTKTIDLLFLLVLLIVMIYAFWSLFQMNLLPMHWLLAAIAVAAIIYLRLLAAVSKRRPRWVSYIRRCFIIVLCACLLSIGHYSGRINRLFNAISVAKDETVTVMILARNDGTISSLSDLNSSSVIGIQNGTDSDTGTFAKEKLSSDAPSAAFSEDTYYATLINNLTYGNLDAVAISAKYYDMMIKTDEIEEDSFCTLATYTYTKTWEDDSDKNLAQDGFVLYVPKGVVVERPIQLINMLRSNVDFMVNRRVLIILEEGAQARLLACDHAMDRVKFLATQVVEVFVGENAVFDFYELEETHNNTVRFSNLYVHQAAGSNVLLNGMTLHNGITRNTTEVALDGRGAEVKMLGMAIGDKQQQVDNNTFIDHRVSDCTSTELYKYVLDDSAVGAFAGKVLVREGAQRTSSQQTNRNLCATREARMYTQPQLEIYADDVKCSHGATVGQLDDNALFYMRQRGIAEREARLLLMFAFVNEVIDEIRLDALKDRLHLLVEKRFRGELNKCQGCAMCK